LSNDQRMILITILKNLSIIIYVFVIAFKTTESLKPPPVKAKVDSLLKAPIFSKDWTKDWTKSPLFSGPKIPQVTRETKRNIKVILITIHSVKVIYVYRYYFIAYSSTMKSNKQIVTYSQLIVTLTLIEILICFH
jgi:hypothetical protein